MNKQCCEKCSKSEFALKGKVKKYFGGICGLACECHNMQETKQKEECDCGLVPCIRDLPKTMPIIKLLRDETKQKEIREKWENASVMMGEFKSVRTYLKTDEVADWWLSEFSTLLAERDAEVREMIDGERRFLEHSKDCEYQRQGCDCGFEQILSYNQALDDITNKLDDK